MPHIKTIEGQLDSKGLKIALVAGRFNDIIVDRLVGGAVDYLARHGCDKEKHDPDQSTRCIRNPRGYQEAC